MNRVEVARPLPPVLGRVLVTLGREAWAAHRSRVERWCYRWVTAQSGGQLIAVERRPYWPLLIAAWLFLLVSTLLVGVSAAVATLAARPAGLLLLIVGSAAAWVAW